MDAGPGICLLAQLKGALQQLIEDRQRDLRTCALDIGKHFYNEDPSAFGARIEHYWNAWRGEKL